MVLDLKKNFFIPENWDLQNSETEINAVRKAKLEYFRWTPGLLEVTLLWLALRLTIVKQTGEHSLWQKTHLEMRLYLHTHHRYTHTTSFIRELACRYKPFSRSVGQDTPLLKSFSNPQRCPVTLPITSGSALAALAAYGSQGTAFRSTPVFCSPWLCAWGCSPFAPPSSPRLPSAGHNAGRSSAPVYSLKETSGCP